MSKHKKPITAEELMKQLATDPKYLEMRAAKDQRFRARAEYFDSISQPILGALAQAGFPADSFEHFLTQYAPLPDVAVEILIKSLKECQVEPVQESLVRALGAAKSPFDGQSLVSCFESTSSEGIRFAILNTIALARPHSIDEWLEKMKQNEYRRQQLSDLGYNFETP